MTDRLDQVVMGRQSIHDRDLDIVGYELLLGTLDGHGLDAGTGAADGMTTEVVFGALTIGLDRLVGDKRLFCNADRALLVGAVPLTLLPARSVIEVGEEVGVDADVLGGCRRLAAEGFTIALDDFRWYDGVEPLLQIASMVKIDVTAVSDAELGELAARCRPYGVQLLAQRVHSAAELERLRDLGFDLFQGFALQSRTVVIGKALEPSEAGRLRMAAAVLGDPLDFDVIEDMLRTEPGLTYQVLQLASLGRNGETRRRVRSVREALVLAGSWRVQNWMALLLARPANGAADDSVTAALARARACELLGARLGGAVGRMGFTAGMLSSFDRLLGISSDELTESLPLSDDLREAAFGAQSPLARIVRDVADHQSGREGALTLSGLTTADLNVALASGYRWAVDAVEVLAVPAQV